MYGIVEANLGITCACVVTLRPLFHKLRLSVSSLRSSTRTATAKSTPRESRKRASLYHITLSSGNNTQLGTDGGDAEINELGEGSRTAAAHLDRHGEKNSHVEVRQVES